MTAIDFLPHPPVFEYVCSALGTNRETRNRGRENKQEHKYTGVGKGEKKTNKPSLN